MLHIIKMKLLLAVVCFGVITVSHDATNVDIQEEDNNEQGKLSINPLCEVCELVIKEVYKEIEKDKSEQKIKDAVHHVCQVLPKHTHDKCNEFVNKHGDEVIKLILKVASPKLICHLVHACL